LRTVLNAEWNRKDREVNLHRHPAFFGSVDDVIGDCCGDCPTPVTIEEEEAAEQESKIYVSGPVKFMKDDCGRQAIGSFNPLSPEQYTDMAYVGNTQLLCQAIVDQDLHYVQQWLSQEGNDPSTRDHTGRCPLHLAVTSSSLEIVQCLIDHGARLVARLVDGKTALHLACLRGDAPMVSALLKKSEANEEEEANKIDAKRKLRQAAKETRKTKDSPAPSAQDATFEMIDEVDAESDVDAMTDGSIVNIKTPATTDDEKLDVQDDDSPDVYDVNVLTWDTPTSPLHLAVLNGHLDVVQCLVEQFGANLFLPVILYSPYGRAGPRGALLTLTLATELPLEKAKEMTRLLFKLGASCAQADSNRKTALECCVASAPDLLQTYLDADPTGTARALRNVTVQGSPYNPQVSSPLMAAISNEDTETALRLLSAGARADIPLEAYLNGVDAATKYQFEEKVQQPVILAVEDDMPSLATTLVEKYGIDCNTMTNSSWRMVHNSYDRYQSGETLLDLVKKKVKQLREWKYEKPKRSTPRPLRDDSEYLSGYSEGSYQHWSATQQLKSAKTTYNREWESYVKEAQRLVDDEENGIEEKQAAIYDKLDQFRKLETTLEEMSAKTFKELHPGIEAHDASQQHTYGRWDPFHREPFEVKFDFKTSDSAIDEVRERYVSLFDATWQGDVKAIKELTTLPWTNAEGERRAPLRVHVFDSVRASPLSIAVLNDRLDVARLIMRIAEAQYAPPPPPSARQYHIDNDVDSDNDDDGNDDDSVEAEVRITSEVIDDQLTIEDIGMVSLFEKTNIKPETMIFNSKTGVNLIEDALRNANPRLLSFLLDLSEETATKIEGSHAPDKFVTQGDIKMRTALHYAKPDMIAELIKRTAVGVSIDDLAVEHKANDATEKSKYYQGLNVQGKKRKDWAAAGRNSAGLDRPGPRTPPLLLATYYGTLDHVQWFLSDAPLRCYKQFAEAHQDDKRLQRLSQVPGSFEGMVKKFMDTRSQLALHCCVARHQTADSMEILKYLVNAMPGAVEARSAEGMTPLLLAYRAHNLEAVKILLEAGADQTVRDKEGMNSLHCITVTAATFVVDLAHVRNLIETIDKRLIAGMCVQRCSRSPGSLTPLALLVAQHYVSNEIRVDMARLILEFSHGAELELLNGEGHTPLHVVARTEPTQIRHHHFKLASVITEHRPKLVAWENATGKSPLEMVEDKVLARKCSDPTHRLSERSRGHRRYGALPSITNNKPQSFIKPTIDAEKALEDLDTNLDSDVRVSTSQRVERLDKLLRDVQAKLDAEGQGKRRLVTLNEASEVARRLAAVQRQLVERTEREEHGGQHDVEQDSPDEVEGWLRDPSKCSGPLQ
jgi:ankyrin repeat protein